jgi:excisionase family DNA binding protein
MSSKILIPKICTLCEKPFIAKTTVTKFCSHNCSRAAWKQQHKTSKVLTAQKEEYDKAEGINYKIIQSKEFLSVKEACLLLGISRTSLNRYMTQGRIIPIRLGKRVIIHRKSINNLLK